MATKRKHRSFRKLKSRRKETKHRKRKMTKHRNKRSVNKGAGRFTDGYYSALGAVTGMNEDDIAVSQHAIHQNMMAIPGVRQGQNAMKGVINAGVRHGNTLKNAVSSVYNKNNPPSYTTQTAPWGRDLMNTTVKQKLI